MMEILEKGDQNTEESPSDCLQSISNRNHTFSFVGQFDTSEPEIASLREKILQKTNTFINENDLKIRDYYRYSIKKLSTDNDQNILDIYKVLSSFGETFKDGYLFYTFYGDSIIGTSVNSLKDFSNLNFSILTNSLENLENIKLKLNNLFSKTEELLISINCFSVNSAQRVFNYVVDEKINEKFYSESYPFIMDGNIKEFTSKFIASDENVLVLLGPPGTGKTKFIRYLLGNFQEYLKQLSNDKIQCIYTNNSKVMELSDDLFITFIESDNRVLVLEDIDFHLNTRKDSNPLMYKLLGSSDGLITTRNKIIISTNIDSESKIDEALIRPGRCFDVIRFRKLKTEEANKVLEKLDSNYKLKENNLYSLSEVYRFSKTGKLSYQSSGESVNKGTGFI